VRSSEHKRISNRELCRQWVEAYRPDRLDDLLALLHPDIEWTTTEMWVEREVWHGHAAVRAGLRRFFAEWEEFSNDEVEAFSDGGDKFAVVTRMRGRSRGTHIPTEMRTSGVAEVRDGLIVRVIGHSDPADALAAVAIPATTARAASQENVELVRRGYDALARGEFDALFQVLDPDVEMRDAGNFPEAGVYRGHQGVLDFLAQQAPVWDDFRILPERFIPVGDNEVLVLHKQVGRSKITGLQLEAPYAHIWTIRDGLAIQGRTYDSWEAGLAAAGLRE